MSSELAVVRDDTTPLNPITFGDPTGGRLVAWAEGLAAAHRIGSALCQTAFVPQAFRGKPEEAAAAILYGDEVGFTPTQALQNIYVISGKPAMYARSMVALVLHHGHDVWTVEKTDAKVTVSGRRRGTTHTITETWSGERARKAGYSNNKKYATDPQAMLYARAAADVCRQIAPDALAGLAYVVEEMELAESEPTTTAQRAEPTKRTARRAQTEPTQVAEPDLEPPTLTADEPIPTDDEIQPGPDLEPEAGTITAPQLKMLHALLNEHDLGDRAAGLAYISHVIDQGIASTKELSKDEASRVIDSLQVTS